MNACACMGPQFGEPFCECHMTQAGLERSPEYKEYYSEENVAKRKEEMNKVFAKAYGWKDVTSEYTVSEDKTITLDKPPEAGQVISLGKNFD